MSGLTRKQFLQRLGAGLGALVGGWLLAGCGTEQEPTPAEPPAPPPASPTATPAAEATLAPTKTGGQTDAPTPTEAGAA